MSTSASNFPVQLVHHRHQNHHQHSIPFPESTNSSNLLFDYVDEVLILPDQRYNNVPLRRPSYEGIRQPNIRPLPSHSDWRREVGNFIHQQHGSMQPNIRPLPSYNGRRGVGNFIDRRRSTQLDLDHMSYEEILRLEERMGTVRTGLTEENISSCLKTRFHLASATSTYVNDSAAENETCTVCQAEYEKHEQIGTLNCGHEYHASCIKQWLLLNNICPICRRPALTQ